MDGAIEALAVVVLVVAALGGCHEYSSDWDKQVREEAYEEGFEKGYEKGYEEGHTDGHRDGYEEGYDDGVTYVYENYEVIEE